MWRQLIYQDNCYERCKPSIDPLADTDRHHHHPIRSRFGLYRSLFNSSLSDKLGEPVSQVAFSFGLLSLGLALSSSVAGKLQERFGVKRVTMASGILLGLGLLPDRALQQPDDAVAERGRAGGAGGRRRLPADPVELREMVPGA